MPHSGLERRSPAVAVRLAVASALLVVAGIGFAALGLPTRASERPLPVLGRVAEFALVDQASAPFSRDALEGEPWVANFVFPRCPLVCPRLGERMPELLADVESAPGTVPSSLGGD